MIKLMTKKPNKINSNNDYNNDDDYAATADGHMKEKKTEEQEDNHDNGDDGKIQRCWVFFSLF